MGLFLVSDSLPNGLSELLYIITTITKVRLYSQTHLQRSILIAILNQSWIQASWRSLERAIADRRVGLPLAPLLQ